jgi:hypothetical protein
MSQPAAWIGNEQMSRSNRLKQAGSLVSGQKMSILQKCEMFQA